MKISSKQYDFDKEPTIDELRGALLERGYQIGRVEDNGLKTTVWSLETTSPARLSVPLCTIEWDATTGLCQLVEFDKEEDEGECPGCPDCGEEIEGSEESEEQASLLEACCFISSVISGTGAALVKNGEQTITWFDEDDDDQVLAGISLSGGGLAVYVSHNVDMKSWLAIKGYCDLLSLPITKTWPIE